MSAGIPIEPPGSNPLDRYRPLSQIIGVCYSPNAWSRLTVYRLCPYAGGAMLPDGGHYAVQMAVS